jgi:hypothetical protein
MLISKEEIRSVTSSGGIVGSRVFKKLCKAQKASIEEGSFLLSLTSKLRIKVTMEEWSQI